MGNILSGAVFGIGQKYPPMREQARINDMQLWYNRSNRHFRGMFEDEVGSIRSQQRINVNLFGSSRRISPNIYRFVMDFWRNAIMSDRAVVSYPDNERIEEFIANVMPSLQEAISEVVPDMVRYGVGVLINKQPYLCESVDPRYWFPVRAAHDQNVGDEDIVAYPYSDDKDRDATPNKLAVYRFDPTTAIEEHWTFTGGTMGTLISTAERTPSMLSVISVPMTNDLYGQSDFADIDVYITELFRRESAVSEALDKQANPHLAVPEGVFSTDDSGSYFIDTEGMVLPYPEGANAPNYVVWDPSFEGQENAINRAEKRILQFSGISPILVSPEIRSQALTGAALRRLAAPTVNKIRLIRSKLNVAIKNAILGQADLVANGGGERFMIDPDMIDIVWPPELSGGITDEADAIATLVGAGVMSQEQAIQLTTRASALQASAVADEINDMDNSDSGNMDNGRDNTIREG